MLAEIAHKAGVITNEEFAIFQNAGYMGLYGGLDIDDIHTKKGLEVGQKILDYMGSTELIANLFRISQTEEKLRKDEADNAKTATPVHYSVGREVRTAYRKDWRNDAGRFADAKKEYSTDRKRADGSFESKSQKGKIDT
ncbi:DNA-damage-inducible protein D [Lachnospiraceae bacterium 62-35]